MRFRSIPLFAAVFALSACSDVNGPDFEGAIDFNVTSKVQAQYPNATVIEATVGLADLNGGITGLSGAPDSTLEYANPKNGLLNYTTNFSVVQGDATFFLLYYEGKNKNRFFMGVHIPKKAQFVDSDGNPTSDGDSVEINLEIDPYRFLVHFGPHGSTFENGAPVTVRFNLAFAKLAGRDITEAKAMYQPEAGEEWGVIPAEIIVADKYIDLRLRHFSNYAVAW